MEDLATLQAHRRATAHLIPLLEAVRSVAEIGWRRAEAAAAPLGAYAERLEAMLARSLGTLDPARRHTVLAPWERPGPVGLLVVSSERGLCGQFNQQIAQFALTRGRELIEQGEQVTYLSLGGRGRRLLEDAGGPVLYSRPLPSLGLPAYEDVEEIALDLLAFVEQRAFTRLIVLYQRPARQFAYEQVQRNLLPGEIGPIPKDGHRTSLLPPGDDVALINHLLTEALLVGVLQSIVESAVSEQLARILAMRLAGSNARRLLDQLTTRTFAAQKHADTTALLEIVAGYDVSDEEERISGFT